MVLVRQRRSNFLLQRKLRLRHTFWKSFAINWLHLVGILNRLLTSVCRFTFAIGVLQGSPIFNSLLLPAGERAQQVAVGQSHTAILTASGQLLVCGLAVTKKPLAIDMLFNLTQCLETFYRDVSFHSWSKRPCNTIKNKIGDPIYTSFYAK